VSAALQMQRKLVELNRRWRETLDPDFPLVQ
jgi:hypothetical protein